MDPVTHAASGAIAMLVLKKRPATAWAWPLAALACASPDLDLLFIHTPLQFLEIHRGISHSFAGAPVFGLLLALLCWPLWRRSTPGRWKFIYVWLFCIAMILLHIWLDVVTTYGTMVFLPFSHYRVRLNSLFIIDLLVTVPLLWALWRWRAKHALLVLTLVWTFLYPASGIAFNAWHTSQCADRFAAEGRTVARMHVLPDAFVPFFWRVIYEEDSLDGLSVREQSLNFFGQPRGPENVYTAVPPALAEKFKKVSTDGEMFIDFAVLPIMSELRTVDQPEDLPDDHSDTLLMIHDLRFGSGLEFVRKLLAMRPDADIPFQLMAQLTPPQSTGEILTKIELADMDIAKIRLRFSDSGRDSHWHKPEPMPKPTFWEWLVGIR